MRRVPAGLAGLALATGVATTVALSASAAPPDGSKATARHVVSDDLPGRAEEKRRALRKAGLQKVLNGTAKVQQRGASKVVRVGETATPGARSKAAAEDQYVELAARRRTRSSSSSPSSATRGTRSTRTRTPPRVPGPGPVRRAAAQPDPPARPLEGQPHDLAGRLLPRALPAALLRRGRGVESLKTYYERQSSGRYSVDGPVTDWVKVSYNEARYGRSDGFPCTANVCANTEDLIRDAVDQWVATEDERPHRRADRRGSEVLRPVGSQRLRRRRRLQRARRLHRPLPDRPRRRRPGRRRPLPGRGRHLVASLEGVPDRGRRPGEQQGRWDAGRQHRPVGGRLHDPARERRPVGLRPRVRPRPRPAGRVRHRGRPRQRRQLVVADGAEPRLRAGARASAPAPRTSGRGTSSSSAGSTTRSFPRATPAPSTSGRTSTTAPRHRASSRCSRRSRS